MSRVIHESCPACEGTGTEYGPGNVIPGWCSLCYGRGRVTPEERDERIAAGTEDEEAVS